MSFLSYIFARAISFRVRLRRLLFREGIVFSGPYCSWEDAVSSSSGYGAPEILERVKIAALKVKHGEAAYERDGVAFPDPSYSHAILASIFLAALGRNGTLVVMDVGGALGGIYTQHLRVIKEARGLRMRWCVVEQPAYVACGREHFQDESLVFYESIDECAARESPDIVILSSVLQYVRDPISLLDAASRCARHLLIDYLPVRNGGCGNVLMVQHVPPSIYMASYPFWIFEERFLSEHLSCNWREVFSFETLQIKSLRRHGARYTGCLLARKEDL